MDWNQLFQMQKQLDTYIETNHQLQNSNLFNEKVLALTVEVGELANETRCFKFWSNKPPSENAVILEEYVDGVHFILSLGLEKGYHQDLSLTKHTGEIGSITVTELFNQVFEKIVSFKQNPSKENYIFLFDAYLLLGLELGFTESDVQEAYFQKNKVNFERQDKGY